MEGGVKKIFFEKFGLVMGDGGYNWMMGEEVGESEKIECLRF